MDGGCAQIQRIIGIFCIAKHYKLEYIHSNLIDIEHRYRDKIDFLQKYNQIFDFKNHRKINDVDLNQTKIVTLNQIDEIFINQNRNSNILVKISYPYNLTDKFPDLYNYIFEYSFFDNPFRSCIDEIIIGVHIRRGDVVKPENKNRYLSDDYYLTIIDKIIERNLQNQKFKIYIYSEKGHNYNFDKFKYLSNVEIKLDYDDIETLKELSYSNILIMSKSSYSYVAGLLNKNGMIVYCPFWHNKKSNWIIA